MTQFAKENFGKICDNGLNFGGNHEIQQPLEFWDNKKITPKYAIKNIKQTFNPPTESHMVGMWEKLTQSVKKSIKKSTDNKTFAEISISNIIYMKEYENILNSRPFTLKSLLTQFLFGSSYAMLPLSKIDDENVCLVTQWRAAQRSTDHFWKG